MEDECLFNAPQSWITLFLPCLYKKVDLCSVVSPKGGRWPGGAAQQDEASLIYLCSPGTKLGNYVAWVTGFANIKHSMHMHTQRQSSNTSLYLSEGGEDKHQFMMRLTLAAACWSVKSHTAWNRKQRKSGEVYGCKQLWLPVAQGWILAWGDWILTELHACNFKNCPNKMLFRQEATACLVWSSATSSRRTFERVKMVDKMVDCIFFSLLMFGDSSDTDLNNWVNVISFITVGLFTQTKIMYGYELL